MPVAGLVRLRKHLFGRQAAFGTKVPATRAYPFKGVPSVDLQWTDPDVDVGSIVVTVAPQRGAGAYTAALTDPQLAYDNIPLLMCAVFGGNVIPTGGPAFTWTHEPSAVEPLDDQDEFTYEFGDDVLSDWFQLGDGILDSVEFTGPEGLGAITTSMTWRFGSASSTGSTDSPVDGTVPTPSLSVDKDAALVYLKDMAIYIADTEAGLSGGQITDALHTFSLTITQESDDKRFANGTQTFDVTDRSRTGYAVELACTFAKTSQTVGTGSEADDWYSDQAVARYVRLAFISTRFVTGSTPYSWTPEFPMRYYTRTDADSAGNSVVVLTGHAFLDEDDFDGFFRSVVVCGLISARSGHDHHLHLPAEG